MKRRVPTVLLAAAGALCALPASAQTVYVSNEKSNSISVIDAKTLEVPS